MGILVLVAQVNSNPACSISSPLPFKPSPLHLEAPFRPPSGPLQAPFKPPSSPLQAPFRPENVREERRDTLPEAFEGEPEQAGGETEEIDGEHAEGEESGSELERSQSFHSGTNDTIASQFMTEEYLEWPATDWTSSQDRAQLSAYMKIYEYGKRQAKAIGDGYNRLAEWCAQQCDIHRVYARVGSLSLDIQHVF